jgi:hypothetical protein
MEHFEASMQHNAAFANLNILTALIYTPFFWHRFGTYRMFAKNSLYYFHQGLVWHRGPPSDSILKHIEAGRRSCINS